MIPYHHGDSVRGTMDISVVLLYNSHVDAGRQLHIDKSLMMWKTPANHLILHDFNHSPKHRSYGLKSKAIDKHKRIASLLPFPNRTSGFPNSIQLFNGEM